MATDGGTDKDVKSRIGKASYAFNNLTNVWKSKRITTKTKLRLFNSNVKAVLLYGAETWKASKCLVSKLQVFINKCLRRIFKDTLARKNLEHRTMEKTNQEPVEVTIKRRTWRWIGHTLRKPKGDLAQQALQWNPQGTRKRGRPKETWRRSIYKNLDQAGLSWNNIETQAKNRTRWRSTVEALCSNRS